MTFTVSVQDTAIRFPCEPNESVLDAAQRAGYEIPYSCRKGVCGTCKGRVVAGEVRTYSGDALGAAERDAGEVLFCNARPRSDLTIAPIASMIEDALRRGINRDMLLYWGARQRAGLYSDLPRKWRERNPRFAFVPVLSDVAEPGFRHNLVHRAVLEDHASLARFQAY